VKKTSNYRSKFPIAETWRTVKRRKSRSGHQAFQEILHHDQTIQRKLRKRQGYACDVSISVVASRSFSIGMTKV
jgi:hypothetical protein